MDITELLKKEHEEVSVLFQRFFGGGTITRLMNKVVGSKPPRRRSIATKICNELTAHTTLEEEVFYPAVRETGDEQLNRLVDESVREHDGVKQKIAAAQAQLGDDAALEETMSSMQGDVDHHVREEENEMFPQLHNVMSEHRLDEIGRRYAARKRAMRGRRRATTARTGTGRKRARGTRRQTGARRQQASGGRKQASGGRRRSTGSTQRGRKTGTSARGGARAPQRKAAKRGKSASVGRQRRRASAKRARTGRR